jgi:1,4-dihydroxy-2-naphthoate octaprenyltransferase
LLFIISIDRSLFSICRCFPIISIGLLSLISGYCYTAGPYPLAYNGLGDIFVFIFFGLIAVPGTYYLQSNELFDINSILVGASIGFLAVAVLCVNNIRDVESDRKVNKKTLVVRFGINKITILYDIMIISSYLSILIFIFRDGIYNHLGVLLLLLSLPIAIKLIIDIHKMSGKELNLILYRTALLIRVFSILLIIGILI